MKNFPTFEEFVNEHYNAKPTNEVVAYTDPVLKQIIDIAYKYKVPGGSDERQRRNALETISKKNYNSFEDAINAIEGCIPVGKMKKFEIEIADLVRQLGVTESSKFSRVHSTLSFAKIPYTTMKEKDRYEMQVVLDNADDLERAIEELKKNGIDCREENGIVLVKEGYKDQVVFSVSDENLDSILNVKFEKDLDFKKIKGDTYYILSKKAFDQFIDRGESEGFNTNELVNIIEQ